MGDDTKEAGRVGGGCVGAVEEGRDIIGRRQAFGRRFGETVNKPVGASVYGRERLAIAKQDAADGEVRLVGGHPHKLARADKVRKLAINNVGNPGPNASEGSVMVRGTGIASKGSGEEGLTVGADGGDEKAMGEHFKEGPCLLYTSPSPRD